MSIVAFLFACPEGAAMQGNTVRRSTVETGLSPVLTRLGPVRRRLGPVFVQRVARHGPVIARVAETARCRTAAISLLREKAPQLKHFFAEQSLRGTIRLRIKR